MRRYYITCFLSVSWIALLYLKAAHGFEPAFHFLFGIENGLVSSEGEAEFSRYELWQMREGVLGLFGIAFFSALLLYCVIRIVLHLSENKSRNIK